MQGLPLYSELLRASRHEAGLTGKEVADLIGVAESTYRNAERGRGGPTVIDQISAAFPEMAEEIQRAFGEASSAEPPRQIDRFSEDDLLLPIELLHGLAEARVTRFHPSRHYYSLLREGRSSISDYVSQATSSLEMVSITLATGLELERVIDTFEKMLQRRSSPVRITVSLLDPSKPYLVEAIAPVIRSSPKALVLRIQDALDALRTFRKERLSRKAADNFHIYCHQVLPNSSAIIIDGDDDHGLIQLETKGYKMGMDKSYGFECQAPSNFFFDLRDSFRDLIADGEELDYDILASESERN